MTYTYTYTGSVTWTQTYGGSFGVERDVPVVGYHPTSLSVTYDVNPGTGQLACGVYQEGGQHNGSIIIAASTAPGGTSAAGTSSIPFGADSTGSHINITASSVTSPPATVNYTIHLTYADVASPPPCQYGTQVAPTAPLVAIVTDAVVEAACAAVGAPWLNVLFAPLIGYAFDSGVLCGTGPPVMPTITAQSLLDDIEGKLAFLQSAAWYSICQCTPAPIGGQPPINYTPPTLTQPPGWPAYGPYPCSNSDICTTLVQILKRLDELSRSQSIQNTSSTTIINPPVPIRYSKGRVDAPLTGSGSISVSGLVGIQVQINNQPPTTVAPGNPPYIYDMGWLSILTGDGMIEEQRLTRVEQLWLPRLMPLAITVGYYLNPGVTASITELRPG